MNKQIFIVCGMFIIFMICIHPFTIVHADGTVDDWLENNDEPKHDEDDENKSRDEAPSPTNENTGTEQETSNDSLFIVTIKVIFSLLLVLGLIYALLQFLKRKNKRFVKSNALENMGGITVGSHKSMQIVRIGTRFFVIGVGENVEILHEITERSIIDELTADDEENYHPTKRILKSITKRKAADKNTEPDFKSLFSKELSNLKQNRKKLLHQNREDTDE